jgi:HAD superfamily hydrolase (TIGR01509 family)
MAPDDGEARDHLTLDVPQPALLFDLDGTLVDSVYQHVIAWQEALAECGIQLSVWRIHRRIGMSGGLFIDALRRETGATLDGATSERLKTLHAEAYLRRHESVVPLPGARELLAHLHHRGIPFAIATSGARHTAGSALALLDLPGDVPVVTRDLVERAKPDPHLFLAAAQRLGVEPAHCFVVGDSVWDLLAAQRAGALGVGLLSGGYGREELERSGAYRVYADPAEMLSRLEEVGVRP